jgi:2-alkyl-3-oxoalkanoate reductase
MKTVFVTGASGFVGGAMLSGFSTSKYRVIASGRQARPASLASDIEYVMADLTQDVPCVNCDVVLHAAALASDTASLSALIESNVEGTRKVFEATQSSQTFIYISSSSVYPYNGVQHVENEVVAHETLSPYGNSKRLAEDWLIRQDWTNRRLVILRPRAIYGVGDRILLPRLLRLMRGNKIILPSANEPVHTSMTHIDNLVQASVRLADGPAGIHIYNVADAQPYDLQAVISALLEAIHERPMKQIRIPASVLYTIARITQALGIEGRLNKFGLDALLKSQIMDCSALERAIGQPPAHDFWSSRADIANWARQHFKIGH